MMYWSASSASISLASAGYLMSRQSFNPAVSAVVRLTRLIPSTVNVIAATNGPGVQMILSRQYSYHRISRNLEYFSADDDAVIKRDRNSLCVTESTIPPKDRPLTLLLSWLMSKDQHVKKFAKLYTDMGMDVLRVRISPFDLLRPVKGSQVVAGQTIDFLHQNPVHAPILVHGFSIGAYVFGEMLVQIARDMDKHGMLMDRFVGQIWDSAVDLNDIPDGVSRAISNNETIKAYIKKYLLWHMKMNHDSATIHYKNASNKLHEGFLTVPSLVLFSKNDVISDPEMNASVYEKWEKKGHQVFTKCFETSRHVCHFHQNRQEYMAEVSAFLQVIGLVGGAKCKIAA